MKLFTLLSRILIVLCFLPAPTWAETLWQVKDVPNVQLQDATQYVTDPDSVINAEETAKLNALIAHIRKESSVEIAVVILPAIDSTRYANAKDFATELFNYWKIGDQQDRGLLILLLTRQDQREIAMETGYGIEGDLPDILTKKIQVRTMVPLFKEGKYGEGMLAGVEEIGKIFTGTSELAKLLEDEKEEELPVSTLGMILIASGSLALFALMLTLKKQINNAESSGKRWGLKIVFFICCIVSILVLPLMLIYFYVYRVLTAPRKSTDDDEDGDEDYESSSSSDSDSGGSWGGGSSGGGGSSTRF